jgi:hypothetical protein
MQSNFLKNMDAELALIEGNQQVATKPDESLSSFLFAFQSHFAVIHRDSYYVFMTLRQVRTSHLPDFLGILERPSWAHVNRRRQIQSFLTKARSGSRPQMARRCGLAQYFPEVQLRILQPYGIAHACELRGTPALELRAGIRDGIHQRRLTNPLLVNTAVSVAYDESSSDHSAQERLTEQSSTEQLISASN